MSEVQAVGATQSRCPRIRQFLDSVLVVVSKTEVRKRHYCLIERVYIIRMALKECQYRLCSLGESLANDTTT